MKGTRLPERIRHWLPRLFIAASVLGMALPTPSFLSRLARDEKILWWSEVTWVVALPLVFVGALLAIRSLTRRLRTGKGRD